MLLDKLQADLTQALKARDEVRVSTMRFLLGAIFNLQIEKGKDYVANDSDVLTVIAKQVKTHKESIEMFAKGGRQELVEREQKELEILQAYLPAQMTEEEIRNKIKVISQENVGADFGTMMKLVMAELRGKADGMLVAKILKE